MKYVYLAFQIALMTSCVQAKNPEQREVSIRPGEIRLVDFQIPNDNVRFFCRDHEVKLEKSGNKGTAVIMESYFSELNPFTCQLKEKDQVLVELFYKVEKRDYKEEHLNVDMKTIKLSPKDQKRSDDEQVILNKIYASSENKFLFTKPFMQPMNSVVTSIYGNRRVYNNHKKGQHLGIDYRAPIGEKVPSANDGKVLFAGNLFYTGNTVIVDHGMDIFTVYGHLSKTLVEAGQTVKRGEIVGLSGNSGRSSGPHVHWGAKVQGQYIDGLVLIDETRKFFKE